MRTFANTLSYLFSKILSTLVTSSLVLSLIASVSALAQVTSPSASASSSNASTAPVVLSPIPLPTTPQFSVSVSDVPLSKLIAVVYGDLLKQPYIVDDSIKGALVTFSFKQAQASGIQEVLDAYLASKKIIRHTVATVHLFVQMADMPTLSATSNKSFSVNDSPEKTATQSDSPKSLSSNSPSKQKNNPLRKSNPLLDVDVSGNSSETAQSSPPNSTQTESTGGEPFSPQRPESRTSDVRNITDTLTQKKLEQKDAQIVSLIHFKNRTSTDMAKILPAILGEGSAVQAVSDDTLLLRASPERITLAKHLISQFDTPTNEVVAKVVVVEYGTSDDDGAGFFGAIKTLGGKLSLQFGDKPALGNLFQFQTATLEAVISAISQDSKFNILESSSLRISSGKAGRLVVGQEVPILSKTEPDAKGNAVPSISYRSSGLILDLKPTIIGDRVSSDLTQELSSFVQTRTSNIDSPTLNKRTVQTSFSAQFGETVLLGGLDESKDSNAQSGLFGWRFTSTKSATRSTLFLVISFSKV